MNRIFIGLSLMIKVVLLMSLSSGSIIATEVTVPFLPDADTVLLMHFDEGTGEPKDSSEKDNDGIIYGAEWSSDGKFGGAIKFYGEGEYIFLGDRESLDVGTGSFTIEAWIKLVPDPKQIAGTIFSKGAINYIPGYSFLVFKNHLRLELTQFPGGNTSSCWTATESENIVPSDDDRYHHVACVYNSEVGDISFYVDGVKDKVVRNIKNFLNTTLDTSVSASVGTPLPYICNEFDGMIDELRVSKVARYDSDFDILEKKEMEKVKSVSEVKQKSSNRFLLLEGLLGDTYGIENIVKDLVKGELDILYYSNNIKGHDAGSIKREREKFGELQEYNVVILANVSIKPLDTEKISQLREFIHNGGGLFILGGKIAYGNGGIKGSALDEVLPIDVADTFFDIEKINGLFIKTNSPLLTGLNFPSELVCPYVHRVKLRENAQVILKVGERPFLVTSTFGKGRVACMLGAPYGITTKEHIVFTDWKDWQSLIRNILQWLTNGGSRRL